MGVTKRAMERQQDLYNLGLSLCVEVGAIEECENHPGSYFDGGGELEDAYKLGNARVTSGEIKLDNGEDRRTLTDAVKGAYEDNYFSDGCQSCAKLFGPD